MRTIKYCAIKFKYKVGDKVYDWLSDDCSAIIVQKRIEYGRPYYRLDNGAIRHESQLI